MHMFKVWMRAATRAEQDLLAKMAGTTHGHLYQLSGGFRQARAELGAAIERAAAPLHAASGGRLPMLYRTDLVPACQKCEFAQKCLGSRAVRAEFPVVTAEMVSALEQPAG